MKDNMKKLILSLYLLFFGYTGSLYADFNDALNNYHKGNYKVAFKEFTRFANQGDASAQYNLGDMYKNGKGVLQDYKEAIKWYIKAADQGYADAQLNLAIMYRDGTGAPKDMTKAIFWIEKSKNSGNKQAEKVWNLLKDSINNTTKTQSIFESDKFIVKSIETMTLSLFASIFVLLYIFIRKMFFKNKE